MKTENTQKTYITTQMIIDQNMHNNRSLQINTILYITTFELLLTTRKIPIYPRISNTFEKKGRLVYGNRLRLLKGIFLILQLLHSMNYSLILYCFGTLRLHMLVTCRRHITFSFLFFRSRSFVRFPSSGVVLLFFPTPSRSNIRPCKAAGRATYRATRWTTRRATSRGARGTYTGISRYQFVGRDFLQIHHLLL